MSFLAIWEIVKPFALPLIGLLAGWLMPSPLQKANKNLEKLHAAQDKADAVGDVSDLDHLP